MATSAINIQVLEREDAIKNTILAPAAEKPSVDWAEVFSAEAICDAVLVSGADAEPITSAMLARIIGSAYRDLKLAEDEADIFTPLAIQRIDDLVQECAQRLTEVDASQMRMQESDLYVLIEGVMLEHQAFDLAKTMVLQRGVHISQDNVGTKVRVIRRSGQVVPWNPSKIEVAVRKAFISQRRDSAEAIIVTDRISERVSNLRQAFVHIEEIQDLVQEELMASGYYKVAEAYILYRSHRQLQRLQDEEEIRSTSSVATPALIHITDENGTRQLWDGEDLRLRVDFALLGLDNLIMDREEIEHELRRSIYDGIDKEGLKTTIILNSKSLMERDADMNKFAGRILLTYIYEEVLDWDIVRDGIGSLKEAHQRHLHHYIKHGIRIKRLNPQLATYDIDRLADALDPSSDYEFDYLGIQTLYDRYLIVDKTKKVAKRIETPQIFWMRVSMGLFLEEQGDREDLVARLYELYRTRRFCSSTPTLFNSGTTHSQLSSCYLYQVSDNIESIMIRGVAENAFLSKWAGGLGGSWSSVRGTGAHIAGTNGESQGVIPFLKLHNDQLVAVNQGGKRRGSGCAYLETWHNDLYDFLELRRNTGDDRRRTHDMNTANWIPDLFMQRMETRGDWTFFRSNEVPDLHETYGQVFKEKYEAYEKLAEEGKIWSEKQPAIEVWKRMLKMLFETGHPWITFKDPCNIRSPQDHAGVIHSSNLCTEITLNTNAEETAVCNLGSVIIDNHLTASGEIDHDKLKETISVAVRALDNVIDINFYPTDAARTSNTRHRPIGLGVMGLANALYEKDLAFASDEAVQFNDEMMEAIAYYAYDTSADLAEERGTYSSYKGSKWDRGLLPNDTVDLLADERGMEIPVPRQGKIDWQPLRDKIAKNGMRNSNVLAIAPTATISNITGTTPCIEPVYKNLYVKSNLSGEFIVLNQHMVRDLKKEGLWDKDMVDNLKYFDGELDNIPGIPDHLRRKYATSFGIDYQWFIDAAARRQKWIDQSQSVNLFLATPDMKTLSHMYRHAWKMGLKTTYYLRTLGASNIEKATVGKRPEADAPPAAPADQLGTPAAQPKVCSILDPDCEACQ